jgi:hypothetical protein
MENQNKVSIQPTQNIHCQDEPWYIARRIKALGNLLSLTQESDADFSEDAGYVGIIIREYAAELVERLLPDPEA